MDSATIHEKLEQSFEYPNFAVDFNKYKATFIEADLDPTKVEDLSFKVRKYSLQYDWRKTAHPNLLSIQDMHGIKYQGA
ncbi:Uncharacterised protein [uncultured archaeon]|nr:Uncharacterised protein [uncultured archaeon]